MTESCLGQSPTFEVTNFLRSSSWHLDLSRQTS